MLEEAGVGAVISNLAGLTLVLTVIFTVWILTIHGRVNRLERRHALAVPTPPPQLPEAPMSSPYRDAPIPGRTEWEGFVLISITKDGREHIDNDLTDLETAVAKRAKHINDAKEYPSLHKDDGTFYIHRAKLVVGKRVEVRAD